MINSEKWLGTLGNKKEFDQSKAVTNPQIWVNTIPKKKSRTIFSKYLFITSFFIIGVMLVTTVKNGTRNLEKELENLKTSVSKLKFDIHYAVLDHEVVSSPENIIDLKNKYLDLNLMTYKKSQIKNLEEIYIEQSIVKQKNIKKHLSKKITEQKKKIKSLKKMYSNPDEIPKYLRKKISNKIHNTKEDIENSYSEPKKLITSAKAQRWAAIQVVKAFLGIPVVPGK